MPEKLKVGPLDLELELPREERKALAEVQHMWMLYAIAGASPSEIATALVHAVKLCGLPEAFREELRRTLPEVYGRLKGIASGKGKGDGSAGRGPGG